MTRWTWGTIPDERRQNLDSINPAEARTESLDDRNVVDGKQDRRFALRTVDRLVPRPVGNRKTVMLAPFEHLVADDARAFTAHDEIGSARRVAVSLRKTC